MNKSIYFVILILLSVVWVPSPTTGQDSFQKTTTENFVIKYKQGYVEDAKKIGNITETAREELLQEVPSEANVTLPQRIQIYLHPNSEWDYGDNSLYWDSGNPVKIHMLTPSDSSADTDSYQHGIAHEYANIILWDYANDNSNHDYRDRNPIWFPEGVSEYFVYNTPSVSDQYPPYGFEQLNRTIRNGNGEFENISRDQYEGGHLLTLYLTDEYDEQMIWDVLENDANSFDTAVEQSIGISYENFKNNWSVWARDHIKKGDNQAQNKIDVRNVTITPDTVNNTTNTHTLTFDVANLSADGSTDKFSIMFPEMVTVKEATIVDAGSLDPDNPNPANPMTFTVNPTSSVKDSVTMEIKLNLSAKNK